MVDHPDLLPHLPLIDRVTASLARRKCLPAEEAEDFSSWVRVRLLEDGGAVLAKFEGRSALSTYLTVVVHNLFRDYRIAKWGKYRPSAAARRMGTVGVQLESLLVRQGMSFDEAEEALRRNHGFAGGGAELAAMAGRLPPRAVRRFEGEEGLERVGVDGQVEERVVHGERVEAARRLEAALAAALAELAAEDRLVLKLHVEDGFSIADVARTLRLEQKPLYRRVERLLATLRGGLEARGVTPADARELLGAEGVELRVDYGVAAESTPAGPSQREEVP